MRAIFVAILFITTLLFGFGMVNRAWAVDVTNPACVDQDGHPLPADRLPLVCRPDPPKNALFGPDSILTTAVNILSLVAGIAAVFVIMIGGVKMITSTGDSNSVKESRNTVLYAVISLAIVVSAQIIVRFILTKLE